MTRKEEIDKLRKAMGTLPTEAGKEAKTKIHVGVSGIKVDMDLASMPENPYRTIFECSVATWGNEEYLDKWPVVSPEHRFMVVKAALTGQTLPQALEPVLFTFTVRGASRSSFDQHARQRFATFFSQGVRDNSRLDAGFRLPSELADDPVLKAEIIEHVDRYKALYKKILSKGSGSFQSARCLMPMGMTHNYKFSAGLLALRSYFAQRLQACEQADTVQVAILAWWEIARRFPLIASHLKPGCDHAKRCTYHQAYSLSELFSCLFSGCGRWPDSNPYATFNRSCSSYETMASESGVKLPDPNHWPEFKEYESLAMHDKKLFNA